MVFPPLLPAGGAPNLGEICRLVAPSSGRNSRSASRFQRGCRLGRRQRLARPESPSRRHPVARKIGAVFHDASFANRCRRKTLTIPKSRINFPAVAGRSASGKFSSGGHFLIARLEVNRAAQTQAPSSARPSLLDLLKNQPRTRRTNRSGLRRDRIVRCHFFRIERLR